MVRNTWWSRNRSLHDSTMPTGAPCRRVVYELRSLVADQQPRLVVPIGTEYNRVAKPNLKLTIAESFNQQDVPAAIVKHPALAVALPSDAHVQLEPTQVPRFTGYRVLWLQSHWTERSNSNAAPAADDEVASCFANQRMDNACYREWR
jgi:hypothetical protein